MANFDEVQFAYIFVDTYAFGVIFKNSFQVQGHEDFPLQVSLSFIVLTLPFRSLIFFF